LYFATCPAAVPERGPDLRRKPASHPRGNTCLAIGGTARMTVSFADGHETILDLGQLA
jgi:hypothetical protein